MSAADSFANSDDRRSGDRLEHLYQADFDDALPLELGNELPGIRCAYETWGTLDENSSNAVLICHAISGDSHVTRHHKDDLPGWWEDLVGPGKAIDTDRFFVICPNVLGGCRGTTGPGSINPDTNQPYGTAFPDITIADMVEVQRRLLDHLKIDTLHAVVGGSLGGHQALTWATRFPDRVKTCIAVATSPRLTSQALAFDVIARNAIQRDPDFHDGQYYDQPTKPDVGLAIARMLGHITYLSSEAMDAKFDPDRHSPREIATAFEKRFSVGSYLAHQGQKFTQRFDANSYVTISTAMDLFDLGRNHAQRVETFAPTICDFLVVSFSSDWLFPPNQSRDLVNALTAQDKPVTYTEITSDAGHDAFLLPHEISLYAPLVAAKLGQTDPASPTLRSDDELVLELIPGGSSVLDLGCGSGRLLAALRDRGHEQLVGVEVAQDRLIHAVGRGLDVIDYDLNRGLPAFTDQQFDVVVLSATLQAIEDIETLFDEMLRVGRRVILGFPNFAHKAMRDDYLERGRSPRAPGAYDFAWYNTPNRRFPSIADVEDLCRDKGVTVHEAVYLDSSTGQRISPDGEPNLNADTAVLVLSR
ncbi:MAG: homoserine O-acetyltransferase [Planctomycetota bacterium]